jgi:ribosomal protein S12 methylthiotransferase
LRSTFIVGFPGETDEDFELLLEWLGEARLERVGAFKYEPVSGAPANDLGLPPVPAGVAEQRYRRLMQHQQTISASLLKRKVGRHLQVIVDKAGPTVAEGRSKADAPEIDGKVHIGSRRPLRPGDIVQVKIERADAYDLFGTTA